MPKLSLGLKGVTFTGAYGRFYQSFLSYMDSATSLNTSSFGYGTKVSSNLPTGTEDFALETKGTGSFLATVSQPWSWELPCKSHQSHSAKKWMLSSVFSFTTSLAFFASHRTNACTITWCVYRCVLLVMSWSVCQFQQLQHAEISKIVLKGVSTCFMKTDCFGRCRGNFTNTPRENKVLEQLS